MRQVQKDVSSGCWLWKGLINDSGYGVIRPDWRKPPIRTHRFAWELFYGPIPGNLCVLHTCDIRACVNPQHLMLGTRADNIRDAASKNRVPFGKHHWNAKLTQEQVIDIKNSGEEQRDIAAQYGINQSTVSRIKSGARRVKES